jgi:hypothetical protein
MFPLSAANVNYTNENEVTKTLQARLREIEEFDPSEGLKNISDITKNVNDTIEYVKDIAKSVVAVGVAEVAEAATAVITALEGKLGEEIVSAAAVAGSAVVSIGILTESLENINATQVKYTKTDETTVTLDTYLADIVSDIEATGDHVNQLVTTLESNALTIAKINEINPYFGIDKVVTFKNISILILN